MGGRLWAVGGGSQFLHGGTGTGERGYDGLGAILHNVGIDLRRADIGMAEEFLNGWNSGGRGFPRERYPAVCRVKGLRPHAAWPTR